MSDKRSFDLKAALSGEPVMSGEGRIGTVRLDRIREGGNGRTYFDITCEAYSYELDGVARGSQGQICDTLTMAPKRTKKTVFARLYKLVDDSLMFDGKVYDSKERAEDSPSAPMCRPVGIISGEIEVED